MACRCSQTHYPCVRMPYVQSHTRHIHSPQMLAGASSIHTHVIHTIIHTHRTHGVCSLLVLSGALPMYTHVNTRTNDKCMFVAYEYLQVISSCIWFDVYIVPRCDMLDKGGNRRPTHALSKLHQDTSLVAAVFFCVRLLFLCSKKLAMPPTLYS
jgi:hypothetical protein